MPLFSSKQLPVHLNFTFRYFTSRKSIHAITIISRITTVSIAIGTAALLIVLSIFNGFEGLVKDLYASFYPDIRITHKNRPFFEISEKQKTGIIAIKEIELISETLESNGLLQYENNRVNVLLKGVDSNYKSVSGISDKIIRGNFETGSTQQPFVIIGSGIANALQVQPEKTLIPITSYLPKKSTEVHVNPMDAISTFHLYPSGSFAIQQDFDSRYAITNIETVREMLGVNPHSISSIEIKIHSPSAEEKIIKSLQELMGKDYLVENRYRQNRTLFNIMQSEKWIIFGILSFILILASFNMIGTLSLLILEKEKDIQIIKALGGGELLIRKIFIGESLLLGLVGGIIGTLIALVFCFMQENFHLIPLQGAFVIDYYPVKMMGMDMVIVITTIILISIAAGIYPSYKASRKNFSLKAQ